MLSFINKIYLHIKYIIKNLFFYCTDFIIIHSFFECKNKNGVVVVRLDAIGDFALWSDAAKEYSKIYNGKKITLLANSAWSDFAKEFPYWKSVWPIDLKRFGCNPFYRWKLLLRIRKAGFEVAIQPTYSRVFLHGDSVIRASGAKKRIGSSGDLSNIRASLKAISNRWYTTLIPASEKPLMELDRNGEFIQNLTGQKFKVDLPKLPILAALPENLKFQEDYFILFPGASWHGKQWPPSHFAQVLEQLHHRRGWRAVLCGSSTELALCQSVVNMSNVPSVNLAGKTTLAELTELIRASRLLIGNDTSAVHIAAAVGTPVVCILGGGHYGRFMPYSEKIKGIKPLAATYKMPCFNCNWCCNQIHDPSGPVPCISRISVEKVLNLVDQAIKIKVDS